MTGYESQYHHHVIKDRIRAETRASTLTVATGKTSADGAPPSPTYKPPPLGLHSPHRHSTVRSLAENRKLMESPGSTSPVKGSSPGASTSPHAPGARSSSPVSPVLAHVKPAPTVPHLAHTHHFGWSAPSEKGLPPGNAKPQRLGSVSTWAVGEGSPLMDSYGPLAWAYASVKATWASVKVGVSVGWFGVPRFLNKSLLLTILVDWFVERLPD
eukprot:jgi/Mesvir1/3443/Mv11938-RA.1